MLRLTRFPYAYGVITGLLMAMPVALSVSWIGTAAATRLADSAAVPRVETTAGATLNVNRSTKAARLPIALSGRDANPAVVHDISEAATSVVAKGSSPAKERPRMNGPTPRGCLSAIGGIATGNPGDNLTICVADASFINAVKSSL